MSDHDTRAVSPSKRNKISGQFAARLIEMLESPAYRTLSRAALLVISRIEIELAHHGGNDNGRLPVTTDQFVEYGIHRSAVAPAIREAEALGFIKVTERGRGGNAEHRRPNRFYLTFSNGRGAKSQPPTHEWRCIKTLEEAERIAHEARTSKDQNAVAKGRSAWRKRLSSRRVLQNSRSDLSPSASKLLIKLDQRWRHRTPTLILIPKAPA
jgi:hypothetical protein